MKYLILLLTISLTSCASIDWRHPSQMVKVPDQCEEIECLNRRFSKAAPGWKALEKSSKTGGKYDNYLTIEDKNGTETLVIIIESDNY